VESQHQDFLEQVARGNHQVLNFLPSIGKLKANVAPHVQHEIIVKNPAIRQHEMYSPITPIIDDLTLAKRNEEKLNDGEFYEKDKPKNFFTFEEPKPETCKICGKGFKNIPALNGHMRLHGGFVAKASSTAEKKTNRGEGGEQSTLNDDSMSSDASSTNSFSSNSLSGTSFHRQKPAIVVENEAGQATSSEESLKRLMKSKARSARMSKPIQVAQHNLMKHNQKKLEYEHQRLSNGYGGVIGSKNEDYYSSTSNGSSSIPQSKYFFF